MVINTTRNALILIIGFYIDYALQLLLMKRGGQLIYNGSLGPLSHNMIQYFEVRSFQLHLFTLEMERGWTGDFEPYLCRLSQEFLKSKMAKTQQHGC